MLGVAKGYLGPAAQSFLSTHLHAIGVNANTVSLTHLEPLVERMREHAAKVMGEQRAAAFAQDIARCLPATPGAKAPQRLAADAAATLLVRGKLRQAEQAYLELVRKHGDVGSYIGLARTQATLEDLPAALNTLREGAAKYAKANDRASAVSLLAEAVALAPTDLAAHRRLAAALANQGDLRGAVEEYGRFVDVALTTGDSRRALLELAYGRETLGDLPGLAALVDKVTRSHSREDAPQPPARRTVADTMRLTALGVTAPPEPAAAPPAKVSAPKPEAAAAKPVATVPAQASGNGVPAKARATAAPAPQAAASGPLTARTRGHASDTAVVMKGASTFTHAEAAVDEVPVELLRRAGFAVPEPRREAPKPIDIEQQLTALVVSGSGLDAATIAASRAALLTGARDARATDAVLDAARRLLALGKLPAASDVLLDYIAHGFTEREAQRLLIEVNCAIGRRDVAREKCTLLSHAYRLDGKAEVAEDVERLGRIL